MDFEKLVKEMTEAKPEIEKNLFEKFGRVMRLKLAATAGTLTKEKVDRVAFNFVGEATPNEKFPPRVVAVVTWDDRAGAYDVKVTLRLNGEEVRQRVVTLAPDALRLIGLH